MARLCRATPSALFVPAQAAEVVSSNIVGYSKVTLQPGLTMLGNSFQSVGSTDATLDVSGITAVGLSGGDMLRFWNGQKFENINYYSAADEGGVYTDGTYETCLGPGWGDDNQVAVEFDVETGSGFWLQNAATATITISGEVPSVNTVSVRAGLTMVSSPLPIIVDIADITADNLKGGDMARFWNGSSYENINYYGAADEGGVYSDGTYETCLGPGWGDDNQIAVRKTIDMSQGFWIQAATASTLTFPALP